MKKKLNQQIFLGITLFILTVILSTYSINYTYSKFLLDDTDKLLSKWNYVTMNILLTLLTLLAGTTAGLFKILVSLKDKKIDSSIGTLIIIFISLIPIVILLFYPGLEYLGLNSDPSLFRILMSLSAIQCVYYYTIIKLISNEQVKPLNYFGLLLLIIVLIFLIPMLSFDGGNRYIDYYDK